MTDAILIDTNVLVYAHDRGEPVKQRQAIETLAILQPTGRDRLSVQTLAEFVRAATKGRTPILTVEQAYQQIAYFSRMWAIFDLTPLIVLEAVRGVRDYKLAYWDAQIWATARLNQIPVVFSEDFNVGADLEGVRFVNPFALDFALAAWA
jgi:predicted nucleic acid-binding protein